MNLKVRAPCTMDFMGYENPIIATSYVYAMKIFGDHVTLVKHP